MEIFEEISEKYEYKRIKSVCRALAKKMQLQIVEGHECIDGIDRFDVLISGS